MATKRHGALVMIVDDDADIRESLQEALESQGYSTLPVASGDAALQVIRHEGVRPQLMLVDHLMPGLKGAEFIDQLRPWLDAQGIRSILMSADGDWIEGGDPRCGADARITKPFDFEGLLEVVNRLAG